jgi:hypothetical protein
MRDNSGIFSKYLFEVDSHYVLSKAKAPFARAICKKLASLLRTR